MRNSRFVTFVRKEYLHILRDPLTLLILIGMPIVEMLIFGFALNMEVTHIRTVVSGDPTDRLTHQIVDVLRVHPSFEWVSYVPTSTEAEAAMRSGEVDIAVVCPPDLTASLTSGRQPDIVVLSDASDPNAAQTRVAYLSAIIADQVALIMQESTGRRDQQLPYSITLNGHMAYNPKLVSAYNFVPGIMGLVMVIICTIMTSVSIAREKEQGSMELLLASPASATEMVLAKTVPYFCISVVNMGSILLLSRYVLEVPIRGPLLLILLATAVYILLALAIGMVISGLVDNQSHAIMISGFAMMMPTIMFSGMMFPIANMPWLLQIFAYLTPATYYIALIRKVMIRGLSLPGVWVELLVLFAFALLLLGVAIRNIKPRLR